MLQLEDIDETSKFYKTLSKSFKEMLLGVQKYKTYKFEYFYDGGKGLAQAISISVQENDGIVEIKKSTISCEFSLAPDVIIINHHKSNFYSDKSWDELVYCERGITENDVKEIFQICFSSMEPDLKTIEK